MTLKLDTLFKLWTVAEAQITPQQNHFLAFGHILSGQLRYFNNSNMNTLAFSADPIPNPYPPCQTPGALQWDFMWKIST